MNRMTLTKIHLLFAAFLFPVAVMFLVTGGLYTWGFKGSYEVSNYEVPLSQPLNADVSELSELVSTELANRSLALPTGSAKVKKGGTSWKLEWVGSRRDVILEPTEDLYVARLIIKETSWYRNLVQLHKAKGGALFKVYAAILAVGLFVILASGFVLAWQVPKLRQFTAISAASGVVIFGVVAALS